jgi:hypothetical protein
MGFVDKQPPSMQWRFILEIGWGMQYMMVGIKKK